MFKAKWMAGDADLGNGPAAANEVGMVSIDVGMLAIDEVSDHALRW
jgi:uncharacterized protein (DUF2252 family)